MHVIRPFQACYSVSVCPLDRILYTDFLVQVGVSCRSVVSGSVIFTGVYEDVCCHQEMDVMKLELLFFEHAQPIFSPQLRFENWCFISTSNSHSKLRFRRMLGRRKSGVIISAIYAFLHLNGSMISKN
ncbi:hypothetical protein BYT27DRAFT_6439458 [Phlegmacium glaucopus]|nr:hypothetical protein BYT27DRAFT_6439458 [Phlegmacium glaucopus]